MLAMTRNRLSAKAAVLALAAGIAAIGTTGAGAATRDYSCPASARIAASAPAGWMSVVRVLRLTGTGVIGGKMRCEYGPARLERPVPRGYACRVTAPGRFRCTSTAPSPVVRRGTVFLRNSYTIDLDTGRVGGGGADLWLHAITRSNRRFEVAKPALRMSWVRRGTDCRTVRNFPRRQMGVTAIGPRHKLCVLTTGGNVASVTVQRITPSGVQIEYVTKRR